MSTRTEVLSALREAGDTGISGETIAGRLGISRVAVSKHVAGLRRAGYTIAGRTGRGYRLVASPDLPVPTEVAPLLCDELWMRIVGAEETGSTNDDARQLAETGAPEGTVVIAARQRAGRGRFSRTWASPTGGVYASILLRPQLSMADLAPLPLVVAVGITRGLTSLGARPALKWPNDVLLDGRKVAGILVEVSGQPDHVEWVIAGIGVNVSSTESVPAEAATVASEVDRVRIPEVAAVTLDGVASAYRQWLAEGFSALREEYLALDTLAGHEVAVRNLAGVTVATGEASGIDETGRLMLRTPAGEMQHVASGEITLRAEV